MERRRRRRVSDVASRVLLGVGALATLLERREVVAMFPESWQVFVAGVGATAAVIAGAELLEGRIDGRRYAKRLEREASARRVEVPPRLYTPPPNDK